MSSKVASVYVDEPVTPVTLSNITISSSNKPCAPVQVTVSTFDEDVLVNLAPVKVSLIG